MERRGCAQEHHVTCDRTRVVVDHGREPGPDWPAAFVEHQDIEPGVIGLPERVGRARPVPVDQLVAVAKGGGTLESQGHHGRIEAGEYGADRAVGGRAPSLCLSDGRDPPVNGGGRGLRPL